MFFIKIDRKKKLKSTKKVYASSVLLSWKYFSIAVETNSGGRNDAICGRSMHDSGKISIICGSYDKVVTFANPTGSIVILHRGYMMFFFFKRKERQI